MTWPTATQLLWQGAGRPTNIPDVVKVDGFCWWCGRPTNGLGRPISILPDTFPFPVEASEQGSEHLCLPCGWTVCDQVELPQEVADRLLLALDDGTIGLWQPARNQIGGPDWLDCDYLPVVVLEHTMAQRMTATIQFNKARGVHQVDLDAEVIRSLLQQGLSEEEISTRLGIEIEAVHRYKQLTGVAELFKNADYSTSWEMVDDEEPS